MKTIILAADHAGFALKEAIRTFLTKQGHAVTDLSPQLVEGDDYPIVAKKAAKMVAKTDGTAVLVCGTGHGMEIAANRVKGVRATVVRSVEDAKLSREHNHANILVLGGWSTKPALAKKIVDAWMATPVSNAERHVRRIAELDV